MPGANVGTGDRRKRRRQTGDRQTIALLAEPFDESELKG